MINYNLHQNEALESIARSIIGQYDPNLLHKPCAIPVEEIMEQVYGLTVEFHHIRNNGRILGETIFEDTTVAIYEHKDNEGYKLIPVKAGTIIIDASLLHRRSYGRFRFTCAHELAHWVIDRQYFKQLGEKAAAMTSETAKDMSRKTLKSSNTNDIIERQANRMASRILMPKCTLKNEFYRVSSDRLIFDNVGYLANQYSVSKEAMKIRLKEMGLIQLP